VAAVESPYPLASSLGTETLTNNFAAGAAGSIFFADARYQLTGFTVSIGAASGATAAFQVTVQDISPGGNIEYTMQESTTQGVILHIVFPQPLTPSGAVMGVAVPAVANGGPGSVTIYGVLP
jgi:hypothetical protein